MLDSSTRKIGINYNHEQEAEILFWSPEASSVDLQTDKVSIPLNKQDFGYWDLITTELPEGASYKFLIDGKTSIPDPASLSQPEGVHGDSVSLNLQKFQWSDGSWDNPSLGEYIIYELHVGTFTPEGTFNGIIEKLDYLVDLGINAIEIMPVSQFRSPGN